jgi:hypothetical protein
MKADDPLAMALEPFQADSDLAKQAIAALGRILTPDTDLSTTPDSELLAQDSTHLARLNYVVGLMRMLQILRRKPDNFAEAMALANFGFAVVKHAEASKLSALQLGRQKGDDDLAKEVATQRGEIQRLATAMSKTAKTDG